MPIRSGLIIALRLFAIVMLFQIAAYMLAVVATGGMQGILVLPQIAAMSLMAVPCLLIAFLAAPIVDYLAPRASETVPEGPIGFAELQAIAFSTLGAYLLYAALHETMGLISVLQMASQPMSAYSVPIPQIMQNAISWIAGFYFLFGARTLRVMLTNLRRASPRID